jgi:hypothetical protein
MRTGHCRRSGASGSIPSPGREEILRRLHERGDAAGSAEATVPGAGFPDFEVGRMCVIAYSSATAKAPTGSSLEATNMISLTLTMWIRRSLHGFDADLRADG